MFNQQHANDLLTQFRGETAGKRVAYLGFTGECLSLVKLWVDKVAGKKLAPSAGGFGDYYWSRFPAPLPSYFDKQDYVPGREYPTGSLVTYAATHHIAIWLNNVDKNNHLVYEQNADPNGSGAHTATRANSRITGILVLKVGAPTVSAPSTNNLERVKRVTLVRTGPSTSASIRAGVVLPGQLYATTIVNGGWRLINFRNAPGYVGPAGWR